ncbi:rhomboid family intramembrane serine protease GlpG [Glaciecola sp.]|nr:rhomboid family intramembrane serine protease GlpG [Glaciecola sp.]
MQMLVCFSRPQPAHMLMDYLTAQRISSIVREVEGQYCVELEHEHDMAQAKAITEHFVDAPNDPRYQAASWDNGSVDNSITAASKQSTQRWLKSPNTIAQLRTFPLTYLVLTLNIIVFALMSVSYETRLWVDSHLFIVPFNELQQTSQWWRLLTPDFLHFSLLHIAFNLLWWWILARPIEQYLGKVSLIITFIIISLSANIGQLYFGGPNFGGMSGVVYGLLGFTWWLGWLKPQWGFKVQPQIVGFMLVWLVIGYADVLFVSMANTAHTLGLVSGCLLALLWSVIGSRLGAKR